MSFNEEFELSTDIIRQNISDQEDEIVALESIYPELFFIDSDATGSSSEELEQITEKTGKCMSLLIAVNLGTCGVQLAVTRNSATNRENENATSANQTSPTTSTETPELSIAEDNTKGPVTEPKSPETYDVQFLPHIRLRWRCPPEYPSHAAPAYSLSCAWLGSAALAAACAELDRMAESSAGA